MTKNHEEQLDTQEQAVEAGSPNTLDVIPGHQQSLKNATTLFAA